MCCSTSNFYDKKNNFLFVKKGKDGKLLDHIFIHLDDNANTGFLAYYESFLSDEPLKVYKVEEVGLSKRIDFDDLFPHIFNTKEEQTWKRLSCAVLPSKWRMFFETIIEK